MKGNHDGFLFSMLKIHRKYKYKELGVVFLQMFHGMHGPCKRAKPHPSMHGIQAVCEVTHTQSVKKPPSMELVPGTQKVGGSYIIAITGEIKNLKMAVTTM